MGYDFFEGNEISDGGYVILLQFSTMPTIFSLTNVKFDGGVYYSIIRSTCRVE